MTFKPLLPFRTTTIPKTFIINSLVLSIIAALSIELRQYLDIRAETKGLTELQKLYITMFGTFLMGLIIYIVCRLIFGFGEGMMTTTVVPTFI